jgi:hypothetical protein
VSAEGPSALVEQKKLSCQDALLSRLRPHVCCRGPGLDFLGWTAGLETSRLSLVCGIAMMEGGGWGVEAVGEWKRIGELTVLVPVCVGLIVAHPLEPNHFDVDLWLHRPIRPIRPSPLPLSIPLAQQRSPAA